MHLEENLHYKSSRSKSSWGIDQNIILKGIDIILIVLIHNLKTVSHTTISLTSFEFLGNLLQDACINLKKILFKADNFEIGQFTC